MNSVSCPCLAFVLLLAFAGLSAAQAPRELVLTVDANKVIGQVDEKIYSHFLEHIYHSCNGGLWGDMIFNRSFEEAVAAGQWSVSGNVLSGIGGGPNARMTLGDVSWKDYELAMEVRLESAGELNLYFRTADDRDHYLLILGAEKNTKFLVKRGRRGAQPPQTQIATFDGAITPGNWHKLRLRCEGNHFTLWLDGKQAVDFTDTDRPSLSGRVAVAPSKTQTQFRNIAITTLDGNPPAFDVDFAGAALGFLWQGQRFAERR